MARHARTYKLNRRKFLGAVTAGGIVAAVAPTELLARGGGSPDPTGSLGDALAEIDRLRAELAACQPVTLSPTTTSLAGTTPTTISTATTLGHAHPPTTLPGTTFPGTTAPGTTLPGSTTTTRPSTTTTRPSTTTTTGATSTTTVPTTTIPGGAVVDVSGSISGLIPAGTTWRIVGDANLSGDLTVEGLLTGTDRFTVDGRGFQLLVQNGGRVKLEGKPMTGWIRGGAATGWSSGDRVVVTPTSPGTTTPSTGTWPTSAPAGAEVACLERSINLVNFRRLMFHMGAGVQVLRWVAVRNGGTAGVLGDYPLHFHENGDTTRGSIVEGVLVEGGKNHAFVPHHSNGITFRDCVAYNTSSHAYWWDPDHRTDDTLFDRCLAVGVSAPSVLDLASNGTGRLTAFRLGEGTGNRVVNCVASCVNGGGDSSGFHWPEDANGSNSIWLFEDNIAHNVKADGIFVWQNDKFPHVITRFTAYNCGDRGIQHGAYNNRYVYNQVNVDGFRLQALSRSDAPVEINDSTVTEEFLVSDHSLPAGQPVYVRRSALLGGVRYQEYNDRRPTNDSIVHFEDCGLTKDSFSWTTVNPGSITRIIEGGVVVAEAVGGKWK
jgi:hypothetical protein